MGCEVCGLPDDGFHFKVLSCRACAAFYRRSVVKQAKYSCKFSNDCPMTKELRKACAACRLQKCRTVGMSENDVQWHRDANGPLKVPRSMDGIKPVRNSKKSTSTEHFIESASSSTSSSSVSVCSVENVPTTSSCSSPLENQQSLICMPYLNVKTSQLLPQIQAHIQEYFKGEKALYTMLHPEKSDNDVIVFRPSNHTDLIQMDRGCLSLIQQLIFQLNPDIQKFSSEVKLMLLQPFFKMFSPLRKCYLTALVFPELDDERFALNYGCYTFRQSTDFFRDDKNPEQSMQLCFEIGSKSNFTANKLRSLQLREIEFSALTGIILANEIDFLLANNKMDTFRDQIYQELHDDILYNYPQTETPNRFGSLICILQDLHNISKEVDESVLMCKIFSPHKIELWD